MPITYFLITIIIIIFLIFLIKGFDNHLILKQYSFYSDKIKNKIKIAFLSDLHSYEHGENHVDLLQMLENMKPDLIVLVGDIIDDRIPAKSTYVFLSKISEMALCFYVSGNHEGYTMHLTEIKKAVDKAGIHVLAGNKEQIEIKGNTLNIIGLDDPYANEENYRQQLAALQKMENKDFTLFLSHRPDRIYDYQTVQADLILSGHAHGGQFRLPFSKLAFYAPNQGFLPKYTSGFYPLKNMVLLVGRGLCPRTHKIPRFYNPPELIELLLLSKEPNE